jgi:hypothetical protein
MILYTETKEIATNMIMAVKIAKIDIFFIGLYKY